MPELSYRVGTFTDSVIRRMTRISNRYGAINLSQGFPDFDPPKALLDALAETAGKGPHQYSITWGARNFREALAEKAGRTLGRAIDPESEICVTCGSTEAMMCAMMTICNPGDKVLVFSPFYENYGADAILSGAEPVYIPLVPPDYHFDLSLVEKGFREGAKAIIICNPSNPCGKVFTREELLAISELAVRYDAFAVTDEVYEHIDRVSAQVEGEVSKALSAAGVAHRVQGGGNLFTVFFTDQEVVDFDTARRTDTKVFSAFFHAMLDQGVYLPPAAFEAWFFSAAHDEAAIDEVVSALPKAARAAAEAQG